MSTDLLEVGASGSDLVDEILDTKDVVFAERLLDDGVVGEGDALLVDLAVPALVDQLPDGFNIRFAADMLVLIVDRRSQHIPVCNVGFDEAQHLLCCPGDLDEDTVVDLQETKELQDFAGLRGDFIDTTRSMLSK